MQVANTGRGLRADGRAFSNEQERMLELCLPNWVGCCVVLLVLAHLFWKVPSGREFHKYQRTPPWVSLVVRVPMVETLLYTVHICGKEFLTAQQPFFRDSWGLASWGSAKPHCEAIWRQADPSSSSSTTTFLSRGFFCPTCSARPHISLATQASSGWGQSAPFRPLSCCHLFYGPFQGCTFLGVSPIDYNGLTSQ